jgi:hypothetical protein
MFHSMSGFAGVTDEIVTERGGSTRRRQTGREQRRTQQQRLQKSGHAQPLAE